jgi:ABC-type branched-subunit amino acid transport system ATPase component
LLVVLYFPGGIAQLVAPLRSRLIGWLARRAGVDPEVARDETTVTEMAMSDARIELRGPADRTRGERGVLLEARELTKRYGGLTAVDHLSLSVRAGEILGMMGPNGAGKTTTFELISGFVSPDSGTVEFAGQDITKLTPEERTRAGLVRSFQDAGLFPTLTVVESIALAYELKRVSRFLPSALGLHRIARRNEEHARELIRLMGLDVYRTKQIRELSTGTRRIAELACMVALEPRLLLLDEPSSGIAQAESEALGELLLNLKRSLDTTLIIVEHDIPLLMGLSDRVVAMDAGRMIADGTPSAVRTDPLVIEAYLGADVAAIERSGRVSGTADGQCRAKTRAGGPCSRRATKNGLCAQHQALKEALA